MPPQRYRSPGRLLAPIALFAVFVALVLIVLASTGPSGPKDGGSDSRVEGAFTSPAGSSARRRRGVYTVKSGDTLGGIAQRNGTTVERLQELNPDLDARTLVTGQKIKLRR